MFNGLYHLFIAIRGNYEACVSYFILYLITKSLNNRLIQLVVVHIRFSVLINVTYS
jgi:hypothetical protein